MKRIYLDYASLTPIDSRVIHEMKAYSSRAYANPSSLYKEGVEAKKALAIGREKVANYINSHADEIIFTSGGTEANNLAIKGVVKAWWQKVKKDQRFERPHIIISSIEHSSIIETVNQLEKEDCEVTRISVDSNGVISLDELKKAIRTNTILISIMMVNNEIGSIQPIKEIAKIIRQVRGSFRDRISDRSDLYPLFHTDAAQALYEKIDMNNLGVDMLTLDGGKIYGPRGVGALYVRRSVTDEGLLESIVHGGNQEGGLRSGTENLPSIMGFAKALEILEQEMCNKKEGKREGKRISKLKDLFIEGLKMIRSDLDINGGDHRDTFHQAPHILNVSIPGIENEFFLFKLDAKGVACSTKSSCMRDEEESYVLKSIGADSKTSLRFSFGRWTKKRDIKRALKVITDSLAS